MSPQNAIRYSQLHARISHAQDNREAIQSQASLMSIVESQVVESKQQWGRDAW